MPSRTLPSLSDVAAQYAHWRSNREHLSETPELLQQQTVGLLGHYSLNQIMTTLGISYDALKRWRQRWDAVSSVPSVPAMADFVELPALSPVEDTVGTTSCSPLSLTLSQSQDDGRVLRIEATLAAAQWRTVFGLLAGVAE